MIHPAIPVWRSPTKPSPHQRLPSNQPSNLGAKRFIPSDNHKVTSKETSPLEDALQRHIKTRLTAAGSLLLTRTKERQRGTRYLLVASTAKRRNFTPAIQHGNEKDRGTAGLGATWKLPSHWRGEEEVLSRPKLGQSPQHSPGAGGGEQRQILFSASRHGFISGTTFPHPLPSPRPLPLIGEACSIACSIQRCQTHNWAIKGWENIPGR